MMTPLLLALVLQTAPPTADLVHPDPARRLRALETVYRSNDRRQFPALLPLLADPQLRLRLRAAVALSKSDDLLRQALRHPNPLVRLHAARVAGAGLLDALVDRLSDADPRVRREAARAARGPAATAHLANACRKDPDAQVRALAFETLADLDREAALALLPVVSRDAQAPARQVAAERAAALGSPGLLETLLADRDWRVRSAAIDSLPRTREAIGWGVGRLGREDGRLEAELLQRLESLSGKDLGPEPRAWRDWWAAVRETFIPPAGDSPRGTTSRPGGPSFFDLPFASTRAIFLLDLSGSMREPAPGGPSKLDVAKQGMIDMLSALPAAARFGIIGLGCDQDGRWVDLAKKTWGGRLSLHPATPAAKADAVRFLRGLEARGWTNLFDGLRACLEDPDADTILLYSDGGASKGDLVAASEILEELGRLNRFQRMRIHCVEVPGERNPEDNRRLLAAISARSGGASRLQPRPEGAGSRR